MNADQLAAVAMLGLVPRYMIPLEPEAREEIAEQAYAMADEMLAERRRREDVSTPKGGDDEDKREDRGGGPGQAAGSGDERP